ncbi:MAG: hypothetical protein HYR88_16025 [Verrucomicrobia bacterium]|nr:hypothetical protein [Verrucomicrobiota bacterium]MBI3868073.1 hypothetical protein [Verrucomicrobiota bacterium]
MGNSPPHKRAGRILTSSSCGFIAAAQAALFALVMLTGCAGYQLGPTNGRRAGAQSVKIAPIQNETIEPRLSEAVNNALRKRIQQDGTFLLETRDEGDIMVSGKIKHFDRSYLSFNPKDIITPRDYQLLLTLELDAVERSTGKTLLHRDITGSTTVRVGADVNSAEREAIPLLAEVLARKAASLLTDGDW